jgi:phosphoribosyl 1,2-cyclic phosphate phosphodiesterase
MTNKFIFLGTGCSIGTPVIGCDCDVCKSKDKKNNRLRPAGLFCVNGKKILVDCGPDFRSQALKYNIKDIDALFLTHLHYDHSGGIDDLRVFYFINNKPINCFLSEETLEELKQRCFYFFNPIDDIPTIDLKFDFHLFEDDFGEVDFYDMKISYFSYFQEKIKVYGLKIGDLAYVTDIKKFDGRLIDELSNVNTLIISAIKKDPTKAHFGLDEAVSFAREVQAKKTYITHLCHDLDHEKTNKSLPSDICLAYDGLEIDIGNV